VVVDLHPRSRRDDAGPEAIGWVSCCCSRLT